MKTQAVKNNFIFDDYSSDGLKFFSSEQIATVFEKMDAFRNFFQQAREPGLTGLLKEGKNSFLVFKHNKYFTVPTGNIAFFHVKYECSVIMGFDRQEYSVNHSLEQIQSLVSEKSFFRLNRQYLINFSAIKEVEHYFARKLLVNLTVPAPEKLLVSKEKVRLFLDWLENR